MSKKVLVEKVAEKSGVTQAEAGRIVDAVLESIKEVVIESDELALRGFGTFKKVHRKERAGVNPATKEKIIIEAKDVVRFKTASNFLD